MQPVQRLKGLFSFFTFIKRIGSPPDNQAHLLAKIERLEDLIREEKMKTEKLKSIFLNNVYHEIRTPMNSIIGFSELLKQENFSVLKKKSFISKIRESSENFLYTIDQLVMASMIETGNIKLYKKNFILDEMIDNIHDILTLQKHLKEKKDVALLKNTDKYFNNLAVFADRDRLQMILFNLVDNALKFTNKGVVEYGYKLVDNKVLLFHISDSGTGIDKNEQRQVFDKFFKANYIFSKENKGLGLGLCIARDLIRLFGGEIWIESNNFGGSTFKFTIPFEKPVITKEKEQLVTQNSHSVV
jgi:signal transduction histidine kinase